MKFKRFAFLCSMLVACACDESQRDAENRIDAGEVPSTNPTTLRWDVTTDRHDSRLEWPADVDGDLWFLQDPREVELLLPSGTHRFISYRSALISRVGRRVRFMYFSFDPGGAESALNQALDLCEELQITDVAALHKWATNPRIDLGDAYGKQWIGVERKGVGGESCVIEIRPTFVQNAPWIVRLGFGFDVLDQTPSTRLARSSSR